MRYAAGRYSFEIEIDGNTSGGMIDIVQGTAGYQGTIETDGLGTMQINAVRITGNVVKISAPTPEGALEITWSPQGDSWSGTWVMRQRHGTIQGRAIP